MDFGIFILMQQRNKHKTSHQILRDAVDQARLGTGIVVLRKVRAEQEGR